MQRDIDDILKEKTALLEKINNFNKLMAKEPLNKEYYANLIITAKAILVELDKEIDIHPNPKAAIPIRPLSANNLDSSGGKRQKKRKSKKHMKSKKTTKGKTKKTRRKSTRRR